MPFSQQIAQPSPAWSGSMKALDSCQLCISLGGPTVSDLLQQLQRAAQWADLIEIRLDQLITPDLSLLKAIKQQTPFPIIWTLRRSSQRGSFRGTEQERLAILRAILAWEPAFIDLEADIPTFIISELRTLSPRTQWIISWHDNDRTPEDLDQLYRLVSQHRAHYYKIATFARTTLDALRMLNFARKHNASHRKLCGICMGELGQPTRSLGPVVGLPFTYASLEAGKEVAPGQPTAEDLVSIYRFRELNRDTQLLGLIGRPIDKSASHLTHNAVMARLNLNAVYIKFSLEDDELPDFFKEIHSLPIKGLSVTMPFKEQILAQLRDPKGLVACNTLRWTTQGLEGCNTDGIGALKVLGLSSLKGQKMVILGAGGTAKAIAHAAHQQGAELIILNRTVERAQAVAQPLQAKWGTLDHLPLLSQEGYRYIIQATSVGMAPASEESIVPAEWISADTCVLDVVSNPPETRLLREVRRKGCHTFSGRELFVHQAVEQFVYWFGTQIPQDQVEATIRQHLPIQTCL